MQFMDWALHSLAALGSLAIGSNAQPLSSSHRVTIQNGTLIGYRNTELHQHHFLGVPYAQPPIGDLRFRRPQSLNESWETDRQARDYGPFCRGVPIDLPGFTQKGFQYPQSEDCLTLNIVRPSGISPSSGLPVLLWIHGGGLQDGGSGDHRYNMSFIIEESVKMKMPTISVSINYRLSGWGFLVGSPVNASGNANLGLHDQNLALRWVHENIRAFGGDPKRVTIQGESSGALSVGYHLLAYGGHNDGLFRAAIAQSGGPISPNGPLDLEEQNIIYNQILNITSCLDSADTLNCLRAAPAELLNSAFRTQTFNPVLDDGLVPDLQSSALRAGRFAKVPLLIGTNKNEGTALASRVTRGVNSIADLMALINIFDTVEGLGNLTVRQLAEAYATEISEADVQSQLRTVLESPNSSYGSLYGRSSIYLGDFLFNAGRRFSTQAWSQHDVPAYSYRFDVVPNGISPAILGATHFQEVAFVFKNLAGRGYDVNPLSSDDARTQKQFHELSVAMTRTWLSFVNTLNPNYYGVPSLNCS